MIAPATIGIGLIAGLQAGKTAAPATPETLPSDDADHPPMTDIHDIKPLMDMGGDWSWLLYLAGGLALLLLSLLIWWLWKRWHTGTPAPMEKPLISPDIEALAALDALAAETGLPPKQFYFRLSAILRRYVERRYYFPAAEMTAEELLPHVDRLALDPSLAAAFKGFCREAEPIKFAGTKAKPDRAQQQLAFCRDFVHQTREETEVNSG